MPSEAVFGLLLHVCEVVAQLALRGVFEFRRALRTETTALA